jgi:hypothetical protein
MFLRLQGVVDFQLPHVKGGNKIFDRQAANLRADMNVSLTVVSGRRRGQLDLGADMFVRR